MDAHRTKSESQKTVTDMLFCDDDAPYQLDTIGDEASRGYRRKLVEVFIDLPGYAYLRIVVNPDDYQQDEGGVTLTMQMAKEGPPLKRSFPWARVIEVRRHAHG